jgi:very-short-patch-repair endonuclease
MKLFEKLRQDYSPSLSENAPSEAVESFSAAMGKWVLSGIHGFWMEPDSNDGHCDPEAFVMTIAERYSALGDAYNGDRTGSPIEDRLLGALLWMNFDWSGFPDIDYLEGPEDEYHKEPASALKFWITPQARIGKYKADFLIWFKCSSEVGGVAVECDGHAFHEKSKEQASRDKERDRFFLKAGFPVMRFTGSDIYRNAVGCADDVAEALTPILFRVSKSGGLF